MGETIILYTRELRFSFLLLQEDLYVIIKPPVANQYLNQNLISLSVEKYEKQGKCKILRLKLRF